MVLSLVSCLRKKHAEWVGELQLFRVKVGHKKSPPWDGSMVAFFKDILPSRLRQVCGGGSDGAFG